MMDHFKDVSKGMVVGGLLAVVGSWKLTAGTVSFFKRRSLNQIREKKKDDLFLIKSTWADQVLSRITEEEVNSIISLPFEELREALQSGKITATKVLHAYQYQAVKCDEKYNFICEPIKDAQDRAVALSALTSEERKAMPLFGIPVSVKESYLLEGYDNTLGCAKFINKPAKRTSPIIQMLINLGAVPFIRTTIAQTGQFFGSTTPIYGATRNPHNLNRSSGGSSSGEGAAIAACSSILGFGSDLGGSVRMPAGFCGIYSIKPTAGRLTLRGEFRVNYDERIVAATCGPMGRDVDSLIAAMRALSHPGNYVIDPSVPPITFNEHELKSTTPLRVGYFSSAQPVEVGESCRRAVDMAVASLRSSGHEIVEWTPPEFDRAMCHLFATDIFGDQGVTFSEAMENDILEGYVKHSIDLTNIPIWIKKLLAYTVGKLFRLELMTSFLLSSCGSDTVADFWKLEAEIKEYRRKVTEDLQLREIDVIICPTMPAGAMRIGECKDAVVAMMYNGLYNLLNFPAGVVPVTRVTAEDVRKDMETFPAKDIWHKAIKKNIPGSEGLPMAVQCVSLPFREERCLRVMKELETKIGYNVLKEAPTAF